MSDSDTVEIDRSVRGNAWLPRHYHFLAPHVVLYLTTFICFVLGPYPYYQDYFWFVGVPGLVAFALNGLSLVLLFSRDIFILFRAHTRVSSMWVELGIMIVFLLGSIAGIYYNTPISPERTEDPSLFTVCVVEVVLYGLSMVVSVIDMTLSGLSLRRTKSALRDHSPGGPGARPSPSILGTKRPPSERRLLIQETMDVFVFKHTIFRKNSFEPAALALTRGFLATALLTGLVVYGLEQAIRQPVAETFSLPTRSFRRYLDNEQAFLDNMAFFVFPYSAGAQWVWNVTDDNTDYLAPNVTTIETISIDGTQTTCNPSKMMPSDLDATSVALVNCSRIEPSQVLQPPSAPNTLYIRIAADYSQWNTTNSILDDLASFGVYMMAANQTVTPDYLGNIYFPIATPFPLHRNVHLRGIVNLGVRRVISPSWRDYLGLQPNYKEFKTFSLDNVFPDASSTFSPNTSSVIFTANFDPADAVFTEDYRQNTFLSGVASIGGIFTILDGIFAMLFGMGLMAVLSGSKAISPFGAVGLFVRQKLRKGINEKYPSMENELQQGGMASFLRDMSMEVDLLEKTNNRPGLLERRKRHGELDAAEHLDTVDALEKAA